MALTHLPGSAPLLAGSLVWLNAYGTGLSDDERKLEYLKTL